MLIVIISSVRRVKIDLHPDEAPLDTFMNEPQSNDFLRFVVWKKLGEGGMLFLDHLVACSPIQNLIRSTVNFIIDGFVIPSDIKLKLWMPSQCHPCIMVAVTPR
jgi:hypothetical protein